jgi:hypothetical protein
MDFLPCLTYTVLFSISLKRLASIQPYTPPPSQICRRCRVHEKSALKKASRGGGGGGGCSLETGPIGDENGFLAARGWTRYRPASNLQINRPKRDARNLEKSICNYELFAFWAFFASKNVGICSSIRQGDEDES